jgi:hypothetical protein
MYLKVIPSGGDTAIYDVGNDLRYELKEIPVPEDGEWYASHYANVLNINVDARYSLLGGDPAPSTKSEKITDTAVIRYAWWCSADGEERVVVVPFTVDNHMFILNDEGKTIDRV